MQFKIFFSIFISPNSSNYCPFYVDTIVIIVYYIHYVDSNNSI